MYITHGPTSAEHFVQRFKATCSDAMGPSQQKKKKKVTDIFQHTKSYPHVAYY